MISRSNWSIFHETRPSILCTKAELHGNAKQSTHTMGVTCANACTISKIGQCGILSQTARHHVSGSLFLLRVLPLVCIILGLWWQSHLAGTWQMNTGGPIINLAWWPQVRVKGHMDQLPCFLSQTLILKVLHGYIMSKMEVMPGFIWNENTKFRDTLK